MHTHNTAWTICIRWFKYYRDWLCVNKSQFVPVIFERPCTWPSTAESQMPWRRSELWVIHCTMFSLDLPVAQHQMSLSLFSVVPIILSTPRHYMQTTTTTTLPSSFTQHNPSVATILRRICLVQCLVTMLVLTLTLMSLLAQFQNCVTFSVSHKHIQSNPSFRPFDLPVTQVAVLQVAAHVDVIETCCGAHSVFVMWLVSFRR
jgi:hypothetical protein